MIPHKLPLGDPGRPLRRLRRFLALHREMTQGVRAPPEALLGWQRGRLFCRAVLRVTGQVIRGAEEPEGALRGGHGLSVTPRWLLGAGGQQVRRITGSLRDLHTSHPSGRKTLIYKHI